MEAHGGGLINRVKEATKLADRIDILEKEFDKFGVSNPDFFKACERLIMLNTTMTTSLWTNKDLRDRFNTLYANAKKELAVSLVEHNRLALCDLPNDELSRVGDLNRSRRNTPHYDRLVDQFEAGSAYIEIDVARSESLAEAFIAIDRWVDVLRFCKKEHDLIGLTLGYSALNIAALLKIRGEETDKWPADANLSTESMEFLAEMATLFSPNKSRQNLRAEMQGAYVYPMNILAKDITGFTTADDNSLSSIINDFEYLNTFYQFLINNSVSKTEIDFLLKNVETQTDIKNVISVIKENLENNKRLDNNQKILISEFLGTLAKRELTDAQMSKIKFPNNIVIAWLDEKQKITKPELLQKIVELIHAENKDFNIPKDSLLQMIAPLINDHHVNEFNKRRIQIQDTINKVRASKIAQYKILKQSDKEKAEKGEVSKPSLWDSSIELVRVTLTQEDFKICIEKKGFSDKELIEKIKKSFALFKMKKANEILAPGLDDKGRPIIKNYLPTFVEYILEEKANKLYPKSSLAVRYEIAHRMAATFIIPGPAESKSSAKLRYTESKPKMETQKNLLQSQEKRKPQKQVSAPLLVKEQPKKESRNLLGFRKKQTSKPELPSKVNPSASAPPAGPIPETPNLSNQSKDDSMVYDTQRKFRTARRLDIRKLNPVVLAAAKLSVPPALPTQKKPPIKPKPKSKLEPKSTLRKKQLKRTETRHLSLEPDVKHPFFQEQKNLPPAPSKSEKKETNNENPTHVPSAAREYNTVRPRIQKTTGQRNLLGYMQGSVTKPEQKDSGKTVIQTKIPIVKK